MYHQLAILFSKLSSKYPFLHHLNATIILWPTSFKTSALPFVIRASSTRKYSTRENLSSGIGEQQRHRPVCASAQSAQHLCYSLFGKYLISSFYKRNRNFLASICSSGDWFGSRQRQVVIFFCRNEVHHKTLRKSMPTFVYCCMVKPTK